MITLTQAAIAKTREIAEEQGLNPTIRAKVIGGGCAGMRYDLYFEEIVSPDDEQFAFEDVIVVIDPLSIQYLEGSTIDYLETKFGSGYKFISPNITGSCGCGSSVSFK